MKRLMTFFLVGALVMLALTAYRLGSTAAIAGQAGFDQWPSASPSGAAPRGSGGIIDRWKNRPKPPLPGELVGATASAASAPPPRISMPLLVSAGPARSRLFVQRAEVGKTPFLGQVSCVTGDEVLIEVVPTDKAEEALTFQRRCSTVMLKILAEDR